MCWDPDVCLLLSSSLGPPQRPQRTAPSWPFHKGCQLHLEEVTMKNLETDTRGDGFHE